MPVHAGTGLLYAGRDDGSRAGGAIGAPIVRFVERPGGDSDGGVLDPNGGVPRAVGTCCGGESAKKIGDAVRLSVSTPFTGVSVVTVPSSLVTSTGLVLGMDNVP